jgi:hypothetical protein
MHTAPARCRLLQMGNPSLGGYVFDYAGSIEIVAREADAVLYPFVPSQDDLANVGSRMLSQLFKSESVTVAPTLTGIVGLRGQRHPRVVAFDAIEDTSTLVTVDRQRELARFLVDRCYMCGGRHTVVRHQTEGAPSRREVIVHACAACGYWESEYLAYLALGAGLSYDSYTLLRRACLRQFTIVDDDVPMAALRRHLRRSPQTLHELGPKRLELIVASVFSDFFHCEAIHVGRTGDGGIDLILLETSGEPVLIQVKGHRNGAKPEPVASIREFVGAMVLRRGLRGIFVTTAHRFTRGAHEAAERAETQTTIQQLDLVDASRLLDVLCVTHERLPAPWRSFAPSLSDRVPNFGGLREPKLFPSNES